MTRSRLNNAGHINLESGHGPWPLGLALLQSLMADVPTAAPNTIPNYPFQLQEIAV